MLIDGQQTSALSCATVLDVDFCKVPLQLCDSSTLIHDFVVVVVVVVVVIVVS